jgi:hypothetical protein
MASKQADKGNRPRKRPEPIPPGATKRASDHDLRPGEEPEPDHFGIDAAGTPGGGTEVGGLAGTNVGDGAPENADLERYMGPDDQLPQEDDEGPP